jgi:hypothetical protein
MNPRPQGKQLVCQPVVRKTRTRHVNSALAFKLLGHRKHVVGMRYGPSMRWLCCSLALLDPGLKNFNR